MEKNRVRNWKHQLDETHNYSSTEQSAIISMCESADVEFQLTNAFTMEAIVIGASFELRLKGHEACAYKLDRLGGEGSAEQ